MLVAVRHCRTWVVYCITSVQWSYFGDIGSNGFQLFLVDTGTVSTGKAGSQRLVPVKSPKENQKKFEVHRILSYICTRKWFPYEGSALWELKGNQV